MFSIKSKRVSQSIRMGIVYVILVSGAIVLTIPFLWMLSTALKNPTQIYSDPESWIPRPFQWNNFFRLGEFLPFGRFIINSFFLAAVEITGYIISVPLVAYGFARIRVRESGVLFVILLSTMMLPWQVTFIPKFLLFKELGWLGTYLPLLVPTFFGHAFFIFLARQFFMTIPIELDDAARIDGCGHIGIYIWIMLPLSKPVLATVAIFAFMFSWNDFFQPLIYLQEMEMFTLPVGLNFYRGAQVSGLRVEWELLMAGSVLSIVPLLVVFFLAQRLFVRGVVITGLKG